MALTLIVEDGTGRSDSNTYASRATGDAYAESRLYVDEWTAASNDDKDKSLAMATRMIDQEVMFNGFKVLQTQALQWPRTDCPDPDAPTYSAEIARRFFPGPFVDPTSVPRAVVDATCEMAIQLLKGDRTGDEQGAGVKRINLAGAMEVEFDRGTTPLAITRDVIHSLSKYGRAVGKTSGTAKLSRT